jgi:hypothetical protein
MKILSLHVARQDFHVSCKHPFKNWPQICTLPALGGERCAKFFAAVPERVFVDADNGDIDNDEADEVKPGGAQCYDFVNAKKC